MFSDSNYGYVWGACDRTVLGTHKYTHSTDTHTCLPNVHALTQGEYFHGGSVLFQWVATGWGLVHTILHPMLWCDPQVCWHCLSSALSIHSTAFIPISRFQFCPERESEL